MRVFATITPGAFWAGIGAVVVSILTGAFVMGNKLGSLTEKVDDLIRTDTDHETRIRHLERPLKSPPR